MRRFMNIAYTSIGKRVMKTDAKGWKVGGVEDDLRQFNHESLVGLMSETFQSVGGKGEDPEQTDDIRVLVAAGWIKLVNQRWGG